MDLFNNFFRGKKVLVTGDTGFKGSWLVIWLTELGAEVTGYALPPQKKEDNFVVSDLSKVIRHVDGDIRNLETLKKAFQNAKPDIAIHMAAQALVLPSYENPLETFDTNIIGTVNFFEAVRTTSSVRVAVNVTSDKSYQNNEWIWGYRESDPMGGNDPYSASKGCAELITNSYQHSYFSAGDCVIASARAGNVIGGGDWSDYRILPDVFRAYRSGDKLLVRNPASTRPWQFVLEPLFGYLRLAQTLHEQGRAFSGGWNFGPSPNSEKSVKDVIGKLSQSLPNLRYEFAQDTNKPHEAKLLKLDISKALANLVWRPLLNFEETLEYTVEGYLDDQVGNALYRNRARQIDAFTRKFNTQ